MKINEEEKREKGGGGRREKDGEAWLNRMVHTKIKVIGNSKGKKEYTGVVCMCV